MYCSHCGKELPEGAAVCIGCGVAVKRGGAKADIPSGGVKALCFLIPLLGLFLYIFMMDSTPNCAKAYGKWGLIGFLVGVVLAVIVFLVCVLGGALLFGALMEAGESYSYYY